MKNLPVFWTPQALDDLKLIYDFIYEHSPKNANNVFDTLLDLGDALTNFPERFPIEPALQQLPQQFRFIPKWNYKIIYRINYDAQLVIIARVISTKQDPANISI